MTELRPTRRRFLTAAGAVTLAASNLQSLAAARPEDSAGDAASLVKGKDSRLIVLKKFPAVFGTPLKLLAEQSITPESLLFVRNNQQPEDAATLEPSQQTNWSVAVSGTVNRTGKISLKALREMPMTEYEMVLQCSGNGRSLFSEAAQTLGTQWGRGGFGNVRFAGVPLSAVLQKLGIDIDPKTRYVTASGADRPLPDKEDFLHSLPVTEVLNRSIIALDLNGKPLPAIHGGPVRLVTPGVYATMNVKWLSELNFANEESTNYNHAVRYRVPRQAITPGSEHQFTLQNSRFNWKMKVKSVLLTPNDGDQLRTGRTIIRGAAFNDGGAKISAVYVSVDQGQTWKQAELTPSTSIYGWTQFQLPHTFEVGRHPIWCRAIDAYGRTQPSDGSIAWNNRGYEWNGFEKIHVEVV